MKLTTISSSNSNLIHTGIAVKNNAAIQRICNAYKKTCQQRDGLSASNKGLADFSNDGVVAGGGVRIIEHVHDFRILFL